MKRYILDLTIPAAQMLRYYHGSAAAVVAVARSGERVRFPAARLRPFVTRHGICGTFVLDVDARSRLLSIERASVHGPDVSADGPDVSEDGPDVSADGPDAPAGRRPVP